MARLILIETTEITKVIHSEEFCNSVRRHMNNMNPQRLWSRNAPSYTMSGATYVIRGTVLINQGKTFGGYVKPEYKYIMQPSTRSPGRLIPVRIA